MKTRIIAICYLVSAISELASAQGTAFTYQGRLNDGAGPANGVYDLRFEIFDASVNGNQISGAYTYQSLGVTNGLFTVTLDFGSFFNGQDRWLDIAARTNGEPTFTPLMPRQQLTPTPYAIFANSASNLLGTLTTTQLNGSIPGSQVSGPAGAATNFTGNLSGDVTGTQNSTVVSFVGGQSAASVASGVSAANAATNASFANTIVKRDANGQFAVQRITLGDAAIYDGNGSWLLRSDPSQGNYYFGVDSSRVTFTVGVDNTGVGVGADFAPFISPVGSYNTALGAGALGNVTNASYNTAVGANALASDTTASFNTANGYQALYADTTGSNNVANGYQALYSSNAKHNTANGYQALYSNTSGDDNVASGFQALYSDTSGFANTANGFQALFFNTGGIFNTATGAGALNDNTNGSDNLADGYEALFFNTSGGGNSAVGFGTMFHNTTGNFNSAGGYEALFSNTTGSNNVAAGDQALYSNTSGDNNTADGAFALYANTTGYHNTAHGYQALYSGGTSSSSVQNVADGSQALYSDTTGGNNTASGFQAMYSTTSGFNNSADGAFALYFNTNGAENTAIGQQALYFNTSGGLNIAIGYFAGGAITTGSSNIDIGSYGVFGDTNIIRVGSAQTKTFIAGISGATVSGSPVVVNSSGQLGVAPSSQRFKQSIHTMGDASDVLLALQPVTFQYKPAIDPQGVVQFGLVAEQVEKVDPDLVVHDKEHGIYTVRYEAVNAMLLNEFLKEHRKVEEQNGEIQTLQAKAAKVDLLEQRLEKLETMIKSQIERN